MIDIELLYEKYLQSTGVSTDSRNIRKGNIFFALKGERFDGNQYAVKVLNKGAAFAVIDDPEIQHQEDGLILVPNVLEALQQLSRHHRRHFKIPVVGITGSNGKTTTKELIAAILSLHYRVHFTSGNFNNHIGVPLTLLAMPKETEIAIIEMGANHVGEINMLCEIAEPTHGLITNIGKAHLEGFGGIEGVKRGKSELYKYLQKHKGVVFVNQDEQYLEQLAKENIRKVFYHESQLPDSTHHSLETKLISDSPVVELAFLDDRREALINVTSNLFGKYNFNNLQTAVSLSRYFKVPAQKIRTAIEQYVPSNNRSQILEKDSNTYIMDAYNANPTSIEKAINQFDTMEYASKIAILGDMLELGAYSDEEHLRIFELASSKKFHNLLLVGKIFCKLLKDKALCFESTSELKIWFDQQNFQNQLILLKGSRGIGLEKLIN